jgi:periplasmic protein TonB
MRDPSLLTHCLVDGDPAANARTRKRRQKALLIAIILEALVLAALLLLPLTSSGSMPGQWIVVSALPYQGVGRAPSGPPPRRGSHKAANSHLRVWLNPIEVLRPPTQNHLPADLTNEYSEPPELTSGEFPGRGWGSELNGVPFGTGAGPGAHVPPPPLSVKKPSPQSVKRSESLEQALLIHRVVPVYPPLALQTGFQGTVRLHAIIGTDGVVREVTVESGHPLLVKAALDAVTQWRYKPTLLNGQAVEVETTITVVFELSR